MRGTDAVAALAELIPVAQGVDERVDWDEVETAWGTRFPSDYVRFMEVYGSGVIGDGISILLPALRADGYPYTAGPGLQDETEMARETWEMCRDDADFDVDPESIVAWAVTSGADIYCWVTTDEDPDQWPILICGRHTSPETQLHPLGMAAFLTRLLGDAAFRKGKISVALEDAASFVNWQHRAGRSAR
ncbi:SMI1/KNR4 family protein [Streptomyces avidinii]|uniref:SMI1/KNR4 family protein n=1 Tax=Streptomyces avidinii TaxID=1895 RepID=UPI003790EDED